MTHPKQITLKACPFCGGKAEINTWRKQLTGIEGFSITCENDCVSVVPGEADAVEAWNRRALSAALAVEAGAGLSVDALAQEIRRVDGNHSLGAGALAEALMPFLAALTPASSAVEAGGVKPPYEFDRYINGKLMAEGVRVERASSYEQACIIAVRIASRGPNGEPPVLVLRRALTTSPASSAVEGEAAYWVAETRMGFVPAAPYQPHAIPLYRHPAPTPAGEWRLEDLTRPIIGIENRTAQEVFDIMVDRIRFAGPAPHQEGRADG